MEDLGYYDLDETYSSIVPHEPSRATPYGPVSQTTTQDISSASVETTSSGTVGKNSGFSSVISAWIKNNAVSLVCCAYYLL